jgi:NadR type nicotinamide-nucleotide adenylyltransferase
VAAAPDAPSPHASRLDVPRLVITGSESTGKTSLAQELAAALRTLWVPEYARTYAEAVARELTALDVEPIARGQVAAEDAGMAEWQARHVGVRQPPPLILDTDLLSTTVYAEYYYGACPAWIAEAARARLGALYLRCLPDLPWEDDGVRDLPHARQRLDDAFSTRLHEYGANVVPIAGTGGKRLALAQATVERWLATR